MKFQYILFISAIFMACNESSRTKNTDTHLTKEINSDSLGYALQVPENWNTIENPSQKNILGIFENLKDTSDQFKENIQIWREEIPIPIADSIYQKAAMTQIKIANPDIDIRAGHDIKIDSLLFKGFEFDFVTNDSAAYAVFGYTLLQGDYGYNFNLTTEKDKIKIYKPLFDSIISTFKPKL